MKKKSATKKKAAHPTMKLTQPATVSALASQPIVTTLVRTSLDDQSLALVTPITNIAGQVQLLKVIDPLSNQRATDMLLQLREMRTNLEARRVEIIRPLQEGVKKVQALFKPGLTLLDNADEALRNKVIEYRVQETARATAEREKLTKAAHKAQARGDDEGAAALAVQAVMTAAPERRTEVGTGVGAVSVRNVVDFEVLDVGAVPREYMMLNEVSVRAALRAKVTEIPGLRIFTRDTLAVGGVR